MCVCPCGCVCMCDGLEGSLRGGSYILVIYDCLSTFTVAPKKNLASNNIIALCNYNSIVAALYGGRRGVSPKKLIQQQIIIILVQTRDAA